MEDNSNLYRPKESPKRLAKRADLDSPEGETGVGEES